jgi:large conductance mechanosensitive channel
MPTMGHARGRAGGFREFLVRQNVIGLAIGVVLGTAVSKLVAALVADIFMPLVSPLVPEGNWRQLTWDVGPFSFKIGDFAGALLDFFIIALVVYFVLHSLAARFAPPAGPPPPSKTCPECAESVLAEARRCKYCGSQLA